MENINVNVNEPQEHGEEEKENNDLTCDHSAADRESEVNVPAATEYWYWITG